MARELELQRYYWAYSLSTAQGKRLLPLFLELYMVLLCLFHFSYLRLSPLASPVSCTSSYDLISFNLVFFLSLALRASLNSTSSQPIHSLVHHTWLLPHHFPKPLTQISNGHFSVFILPVEFDTVNFLL